MSPHPVSICRLERNDHRLKFRQLAKPYDSNNLHLLPRGMYIFCSGEILKSACLGFMGQQFSRIHPLAHRLPLDTGRKSCDFTEKW